MMNAESAGFMYRMFSALSGALQRGILGKAADGYMKQFSGGDEYWDRTIAAVRGWPGEGSEEPSPHSTVGQQVADPDEAPVTASGTTGPERESFKGWTEHQRDEYLARNPCARVPYELEADLRRLKNATISGKALSPALPTPTVEKEP